ncbi:hypothetical protein P3S67_016521 [Capsicum chacoense]
MNHLLENQAQLLNHEPSLMDFDEQTPPAEQNPSVVESVRESTQKINVSGGTYHDQVLMKVDMNAIESSVKTYVEIDSSNKYVEKNETHCNDLETLKEHPKDVPEKRYDKSSIQSSHKFNFDDPAIWRQTIEVQNVQKDSETEVKNVAFQHTIDNTIADFSSPVSAIQSEELLQKKNLSNLILPTKNTEFSNELWSLYLTIFIFQVSCTVISSEIFQDVIDNIIAGMCTLIAAVAINLDDLLQNVNFPDPSLQTGNVEVLNELRMNL